MPPAGVPYVTVHLGAEEFAIASSRVKGVMDLKEFERFEGPVTLLSGTVKIRGRSIPVLDLKLKLALGESARGPKTAIVLVDLPALAGLRVGLMVERISEIFWLKHAIEPLPLFGENLEPAWMIGTAQVKRRRKTLIDIDRLLAGPELEELRNASIVAAC